MEMAEVDPGSVLEAIPALEAAAKADDETTRSFVAYTVSTVAEEHPEAVVPAIDALIEMMQDGDATTQATPWPPSGRSPRNIRMVPSL